MAKVNLKLNRRDQAEDGALQVENIVIGIRSASKKVADQIATNGSLDFITVLTAYSELHFLMRFAARIQGDAVRWPLILEAWKRRQENPALDGAAELTKVMDLAILALDAGLALLGPSPASVVTVHPRTRDARAVDWATYNPAQRAAFANACQAILADIPDPAVSEFQKSNLPSN